MWLTLSDGHFLGSMVMDLHSAQLCAMIICGLRAAKYPYMCPLLYECTLNDGFNDMYKGHACEKFPFHIFLNWIPHL